MAEADTVPQVAGQDVAPGRRGCPRGHGSRPGPGSGIPRVWGSKSGKKSNIIHKIDRLKKIRLLCNDFLFFWDFFLRTNVVVCLFFDIYFTMYLADDPPWIQRLVPGRVGCGAA